MVHNTKTLTLEQRQKKYAASVEEVAQTKRLEKMAERGEWPEGATVHIGRLRELDEDSQMAAFRLSAAKVRAVNQKAAQQGKSRSDALREGVDERLLWA